MKLTILLLISIINENVTANNIDRVIPLEHIRFTNLTIELGASSLNDVFSIFGETDAWKRKDKNHSSFYYCYQLNSKTDVTWVVLGFGWSQDFKKLDSIRVTSVKSDILGSCKSTDVSTEKMTTQSGIHIGLSDTEALKFIENKPLKKGNNFTHRYQWYEKYKAPKTYPTSDLVYIGLWHYGSIGYQIVNDVLVSYYITIGGELNGVTKDTK